MFHGSSHLDQRYLGDDATGSAAQNQTSPDATGAVAPGTIIPAPIITPASGASALIEKYKPLLTVAVVAAVVYWLLNQQKKAKG